MAYLIHLVDADDNTPVVVNLENVTHFSAADKGTRIFFDHLHSIKVKEDLKWFFDKLEIKA